MQLTDDILKEHIEVAIAIAPMRDWDQWVEGMTLVLTSELINIVDHMSVKNRLLELLFDRMSEGCCPQKGDKTSDN